ncbi:MYND-type domain-containing protein [Mycena sanguinolenta]|uniref:MYND-type domain-containing protein n=1 Tax=Mycena sanguinolenta TaxID=230812 RepID=A0A8H6YLY4_9AGAR|nr:MYND-type domain-containing protein [Mycena sanguinolenta]
MPTHSNLAPKYIPGSENPGTSFTISLGDDSSQNEESGGTKSWRDMQFISPRGNGRGAQVVTFGNIADKIPPKPSLKRSCEMCGKRPDQEGEGYSVCSSCKISHYCSRECQANHWKQHKQFCESRVKYLDIERALKAKALTNNGPFVSQASLREWYHDNVDIVDYAVGLFQTTSFKANKQQIVQALELYKGREEGLWKTHAVVFSLQGAVPFTDLMRRDSLGIYPVFLKFLGSGSRIILIFILNGEKNLLLLENHDLPLDEEWAKMEKDEMWKMRVRMRKMVARWQMQKLDK